jgi:hypothetical protein
MRFSFVLFAVLAMLGCTAKPKSPSAKAVAAAPAASAKTQSSPESLALATSEVLACDRTSILYDPSEHKKAPDERRRAGSLAEGETAWVNMLYDVKGHVYVNKYTHVESKATEENALQVRRVNAGFLVDCDSPDLYVFLDEKSEVPAAPGDLIPVVGHFQKPRRKSAATLNTPAATAISPTVIFADPGANFVQGPVWCEFNGKGWPGRSDGMCYMADMPK